jgi:hypothetical protein
MLLVDLLTPTEEASDAKTARLRLDSDLLAERLASVTDRLGQDAATRTIRIGCFIGSPTAAIPPRPGRPSFRRLGRRSIQPPLPLGYRGAGQFTSQRRQPLTDGRSSPGLQAGVSAPTEVR